MKNKFLCCALAVIMCVGVFASCKDDSPIVKADPTLAGITLVDGSFSAQYRVGDVLNLANAKINVKLSDDTSSQKAISAEMVTGFDSTALAASKNLTVTYKLGEITKTVDFTYSVIAAKTLDEKYSDMLELNLARGEYRVDVYVPDEVQPSKFAQINTKRAANGDLIYCNFELLLLEGSTINSIYDNNIYYDYENNEYYKCTATQFAASNTMRDILYLLKYSEYSNVTEIDEGYTVNNSVMGDCKITLANGVITEIFCNDIEITIKFVDEFVKTEPSTDGLTFLQDYDINVVCGCDIHTEGRFIDNMISIDKYYKPECKKAGKEVEYIYIDESKTVLLDVFTTLNSDLTLYVAWRDETALVRWQYGTSSGEWTGSDVTIGETVEPYMVRDRNMEDVYIEAWYTDIERTIKFDFATPITEDITLYGKLVPEERTRFEVTFNYSATNAPTGVTTREYARDGEYVKPFDTSKLVKGMISEGWYTDSTRTEKFDPKTPITQNTELYIKLVADTRTFYTVTVICGEEGHTHAFKIARFETLNGSEFSGECGKSDDMRYDFFTNAELTGSEYENSMPISHDCTMYVKWTA